MPAHDRDKRVQEEAKWFCKRQSSYPHPCHEHRPTLEEFKSRSFSDFVRHVVLKKGQRSLYDSDSEEEEKEKKEMLNNHTSGSKHQSTVVADTTSDLDMSNRRSEFNDILQVLQSPPMHLKQGMAKVTLPKGCVLRKQHPQSNSENPQYNGVLGWQVAKHNDDGINGPIPLGDLIIPSPIKQCIRGIGGIYEYTFLDQPSISVADFESKAQDYFQSQVGGGKRFQPSSSTDTNDPDKRMDDETIEMLERKFWKRLGPTMQPAMYGADMEGTLFDPGEDCCGWNVSNLSSCLQLLLCDQPLPPEDHDHIKGDGADWKARSVGIPGVTTPYLYFGMWASVFCAHTEDMNLLSINYLHAGAPKLWYAVAPGEDARRLEQLCEGHYHQAKTKCSEYLRHKRSLISPHILKKAGIPFTRTIQYPGDAVITFPGGYHQGFNIGFNIAEATNFAVPEWVAFGKLANVCLCRPDSVRIDMNKFERLLQKYERQRFDQQRRNKRRAMMPWKEWALEQARKKKKPQQEEEGGPSTQNSKQHNSTTIGGSPEAKLNKKVDSPSKSHRSVQESDNNKPSKPKPFWVEVMRPIQHNETTKMKSKKSRNKRKKPNVEDDSDEIWHLAKPVVRKLLRPSTKVLCIVPMAIETSIDDQAGTESDEDDEQCFAGVITEFSDDHVRVRLAGFSKKDDLWMPIQSPKLFLDGGRWGDTQDEQELPPRHYWLEQDSKRRCV